ncbi:hypothetical protein E2C01_095628 [Portunus trituberculatus]|uniref:Uncharacterized protein n=1 Tax=Portunus trituberculatus TaxID=210409 RepID=A0A5B7JQB1_PORTR|nr:hypothetical protein [Portunus trituberculatus]
MKARSPAPPVYTPSSPPRSGWRRRELTAAPLSTLSAPFRPARRLQWLKLAFTVALTPSTHLPRCSTKLRVQGHSYCRLGTFVRVRLRGGEARRATGVAG